MHKKPQSANRLSGQQPQDAVTRTRSELLHVCELYCAPEGLLEAANTVGPVLCFARNRHCILGYSGSLPDLKIGGGFLRGLSADASMTLHFDRWRYAYMTHEQACDCGAMMGVEFFDENRNAIFRVALTPDSDRMAWRELTQTYHLRCVSGEEFGDWRRLAELQPMDQARHAAAADTLTQADVWSAPFYAGRSSVEFEMGFDGDDYLATAVIAEAIEEEQEIVLTASGGFGCLGVPLKPCSLERIHDGWVFVGGEGRAMRLNTRAVAQYWIGLHRNGDQGFSYFEAVDVFGDLIFRLTSDNAQSYRYWQALARVY
ncbi:ChuX/HutX family heme-like substrate-binding protein [Cerasicoccus maritimus]|uniref:ChuX/HutX family heme-like substrate-binding protein n=1 Tax=Cerasicoccus maritimus TaxID=490089 RepID=UPI002852A605|nr:ChuX/HutX family heme-like substrate-binding protein [Cerasicoccus maritimus]